MTKPLSKEEKKQRKQARKQQKAKSTTVKTITQPKPTEPPPSSEAAPTTPSPVNLCDDCAYEFGECEGVPKFAQEEGADDRVVECPAFFNVAKMPTADQGKTAAPGPAAAEGEARVCDVEHLGNYPDCFRDCPKDECDGVPAATQEEKPELVATEPVEGATEEEKTEDLAAMEADLEARRKKTQRFYQEEDFGTCQSCDRPLKRTALNRDRDAVRCVNGRCNQYRFVIKTIPTGV